MSWGVASRVYDGEIVCGDDFVARAVTDGFLVGVVDGLGHGEGAAAAARVGLAALEADGENTVMAMMARCHERLKGTRGVTLSIASFDARQRPNDLDRCGQRGRPRSGGRIRGDGPPASPSCSVVGVVGLTLPTLRQGVIPVRSGDTLIPATDGIRGLASASTRAGTSADRRRDSRGTCQGSDDALRVGSALSGKRAMKEILERIAEDHAPGSYLPGRGRSLRSARLTNWVAPRWPTRSDSSASRHPS